MRILTLIAVLTLGLVACGGAEPDTGARESSPARTGSELTSRCVNEQVGYRVRYPDGWFTNDGDVLPACSVFHDERIELEQGTEIPFTMSVSMTASNVAFAEASDEQDRAIDVSSREETTVDGRDAVSITGEGTGQALVPDGMAVYRYTIDLPDGTLIARTYEAGDDAFERKRQTLDRMMDSLEFGT